MKFLIVWLVCFSIFQIFIFCAGEISFPREYKKNKRKEATK